MKKKWLGFLTVVMVLFCLYAAPSMAATLNGDVLSTIDYCYFSNDSSFPYDTTRNIGKDGAAFNGNSGLLIRGWFTFNCNLNWIDMNSVNLAMHDENGEVYSWNCSNVYGNPSDFDAILKASNGAFAAKYGAGTTAGTTKSLVRFEFRISDFDALAQRGIIQPGKKYSFHIDVYEVKHGDTKRGARLRDKMFSSSGSDRSSHEQDSFFATYYPIYYNSVGLKLGGTEYNDPNNRGFNELNKKIRVEGWATTTEGEIYEAHLVFHERQPDSSMKEVRRIKLPTNTNPDDAADIKGHGGLGPAGGTGKNAVQIDYTYTWTSGEGTELVPDEEYLIFVDFWYRPNEGGNRVFRTAWRSDHERLSGKDTCYENHGWFVNYERPLNWTLDTSTDFYLDEWGKSANDAAVGSSALVDGTIQWAGWAVSRGGYKLSGLEMRFTCYKDNNKDGDYIDRNEEAWDTGWLDTTSHALFYEPGAAQTQAIGTGVLDESLPGNIKDDWTVNADHPHRFRVRINPYRLISTNDMEKYFENKFEFDVYFKFTFTNDNGDKQTYGTLINNVKATLKRTNTVYHSLFNGEPAIGETMDGRDFWYMYYAYYIKDTGHFLVKYTTDGKTKIASKDRQDWIWKVNTKWDGTGEDVTNIKDEKGNRIYEEYAYGADGKPKVWTIDSWPNGGVYSATRVYPVVHTNSIYIEAGFRTNAYNPKLHDSIKDSKIRETIKAHEDRTHYEKAFSNPAAHHGVTQADVDDAMSAEAQARANYLANRSNLTGVKRIQCTWDSRAFDSYFGDLYDVGMYHDADWGKRALNTLFEEGLKGRDVRGDTFYGRFLSGISDAKKEMHTLQEQGSYVTRSAIEGNISAIDLADGPHMFRFTFTEDWGDSHFRRVPGNKNRIFVVHKEEDYILDVGEVGSSPFGDKENKIWQVDENGQWHVDVWRAWRLADESKPEKEKALSYYIEKIQVRNYKYKDETTNEARRAHVLTDKADRVKALFGTTSDGSENYDHPKNLAWKVPEKNSTFYIKYPIAPGESKEVYARNPDRLSSHGTDPDDDNQETYFSYVVPSELLSEKYPSGTVHEAKLSYVAYGKDERIFSPEYKCVNSNCDYTHKETAPPARCPKCGGKVEPINRDYGVLRRGTLTLRFTVNHDFELEVDTTFEDPALNQPFEGWFQYVDLTVRNNKHIHYDKFGYDIATAAQKEAGGYGQPTDVTVWEAVNGVFADQPKYKYEISFDGGGFNTTTKKPDNSIAATPSVWRQDYDPKNPNSPGNHEGMKLTYEPNPDPNLEAEHTLRFVVNADHYEETEVYKDDKGNIIPDYLANNVVEKTFRARTFYEFKLGDKFDEDIVDENGNVWHDQNGDGVKDEEDIYKLNKEPQLMGDLNGDGENDSVFIKAEETGNGYLYLDFYTRNAVTRKVAKNWLKNGKTTTFTVPLSIYVKQGDTTFELYSQGYRVFDGTTDDATNVAFNQALASSPMAGVELTFAPNQVLHHQMLLKMPEVPEDREDPENFVDSGKPFTLEVVLNEKATTDNKGKNYEHEVIPGNNTEIEHMGYDFSVTMGKPQVKNAGSLTSDAYGYVYQAGPGESLTIPFTITNKDKRAYKNVVYEVIRLDTDEKGNPLTYDPLLNSGDVMETGKIDLAANSSQTLNYTILNTNLIHQNAYLIRVNYEENSLYGCYNAQRERNSGDNYTQYVRILVGRNSNFRIEPIIPTELATGKLVSYMEGETVISGFRIYSDEGFDLEHAVVTFEVLDKDGANIVNMTENLAIPNHNALKDNEPQIAYFKWTVPTDYEGDVECRATVQAKEEKYFDQDQKDNTTSIKVKTVKKMVDDDPHDMRMPVDTKYVRYQSEKKLPDDPALEKGTASWKEYKIDWKDKEHTKYEWLVKNYNIKLDVDVTLGAQTGASNYVENGVTYMRSGYGFSQTVQYTPSASISGDRYVAPQLAYSLFPEFAYSNQGDYPTALFEDIWKTYSLKNFRVLEIVPEIDGTRPFKFKENDDATNATNKRVHFIPVAFPDREYKIFTKLTHAWTPVGMLSTSKVETINIKGSMYDDYSVGRKAQGNN